MPLRGYRRRHSSDAGAELQAYARRLARAETITRIVCVALGLAFAVGSVAFFVLVIRVGPAATRGAVIGALLLAVPAWFLLRRGLTGRDVDRDDVDGLTRHNLRLWWR
ncbi:MAG: hypothetical protein FJX75_06635 [Armatimonadetes bacterium]|nr:hypothetical protein [Armatimonadota bacterium]